MITQNTNQVITTTDYSIFTPVMGNRDVNRLHIKRLSDSFKDKYLVSPIIVNEHHQIIDGQHRFEAAKQLGLPIRYIQVVGYGLKEVQVLNMNSKNWSKQDFLNAYCDLGYDAYLKMKTFMAEFPDFKFLSSEILLTHNSGGANNKRMVKFEGKESRQHDFQNGLLKIPDLELSYIYARKIMLVKPYFTEFGSAQFVSAMIGLFKNSKYDHNLMLHKMDKYKYMLERKPDRAEYIKLLENIYNYRNQTKVSLRY
jgi:hypothetical protein